MSICMDCGLTEDEGIEAIERTFDRAKECFDPSKGELKVFARVVIRDRIKDVRRKRLAQKRLFVEFRGDPCDVGSGPEPDPSQACERKEVYTRIDEGFENLDPPWNKILRKKFCDGFTFEQLAREFAIPLTTLHRGFVSNVLKLQRFLTRNDVYPSCLQTLTS